MRSSKNVIFRSAANEIAMFVSHSESQDKESALFWC